MAATVISRLAMAALLPTIQDEAYYYLWATSLDLGYLDHPPLVAWMGITSLWANGSPLISRLGTILVSTLVLFFGYRLLKVAGLTDTKQWLAGLTLLGFNLGAILTGFLTTPDTILILAWTIALHEAAVAITADERRWVSAGIACGIGLLGKYIMVVMGLVFLWTLLRNRRFQSRWPWIGAFAALLVFSPHVIWNMNNHWATFRFQLGYRFADTDETGAALNTDLPHSFRASEESSEWELGSYFGAVYDHNPPGVPSSPPDYFHGVAGHQAELFLSQLALWGAFAIPLVVLGLRWTYLRVRKRAPGGSPSPIRADLKNLFDGACWIPLILFGLVGLFTRVEANWPAVYLVAASVLLAPVFASRARTVAIGATVNLLLAFGLITYTLTPTLSPVPRYDRMLIETHGYRELADFAETLEGPLLADSYQNVSMIKYYRPDVTISQWPYLDRLSELTRREEFGHHDTQRLLDSGRFWLITRLLPPPGFPGFRATELIELRDCVDEGFQVTRAFEAPVYTPVCPDGFVHPWYVVQYEHLTDP
jgi:4-amino-4-deoxy-L-arabinose transferase-like glycosyltransferase